MERGTLRVLTPTQVAAIQAVLPATQAATDGATLYANNCADCHGPLGPNSDFAGAGIIAGDIQNAIDNNTGKPIRGFMGRGTLRALNPDQVSAIASVLP